MVSPSFKLRNYFDITLYRFLSCDRGSGRRPKKKTTAREVALYRTIGQKRPSPVFQTHILVFW